MGGDRNGYNAEFLTFVELLNTRASERADKCAYTFLVDGETDEVHRTYSQLHTRAKAIAAALQEMGLAGERAVLLYPPGLEYIDAFFGCLYAGVVAVPAYPPRPKRSMARVQAIAKNADAKVALTTTYLAAKISLDQNLAELGCLATDTIDDETARAWVEPEIDDRSLAFLQYTSGSTGTPKGVMVSHGNLLYNQEMVKQGFGHSEWIVGLGWLPLYHDMGLIGKVLQTAYLGCRSVLMSPVHFLQKPFRWLDAISRHRGTTCGGPNFAFDLCVRGITPQQRETLDLRSWEVAFTGAEPVRAETIERFCQTFAPCGFRPEAFYPCYGMAETTLIITGGLKQAAPVVKTVRQAAMEENRIIPAGDGDGQVQHLVGCGKALLDEQVAIVDSNTMSRRAEDEIGEIWVSGANVTQGYWNRPKLTRETFQARLSDSGEGPFLRTGDLGFLHDGELFVTGRVKDLIIIRGRNHYPQDIESTVEQSHPALRAGCGAAFSISPNGEERLVVAQEVERTAVRNLDVDSVAVAVRRAISERHDLQVDTVLLVKTYGVPKTSSGKIKRRACLKGFLDGSLKLLGKWQRGQEQDYESHSQSHSPEEADDEQNATALPAASERVREIETWLARVVAGKLEVSLRQIDVRQPFARYGLDSVATVSLAGELEQWLDRRLSPTLAYDYPSIELLARHLAEEPDASASGISAAESGETAETKAIAIVGLGCRLPKAESPDAFWRLLREGVDAITEIPPERWDVDALFDAKPGTPGKMNTRWGGFLEQVDGFDPQFFEISPREAENVDPQQRLLLEVSWEALEHAAISPERLAGSRTGVFVGISNQDYSRLQVDDPASTNGYTGPGNAMSMAANRLSYVLDFRGPSWAIDSACSSSLVAVHQACRSLRRGECDLALAGAVNLLLSPDPTIAFSQMGMMAADGRSKAFDADADGYVRSEGCGVVVLKRLSDAVQDGDSILAVVRGSAVNHAGRSNGLTAPNGPAQQAVMREALDDAGVAPAEIGYVEAHGTGTPLGDPIEFNALKAVVLEGRGSSEPCLIGSVKTNIGHLEAAAGIAGLIKTVLCLQHGEIPAHLHLKRLNPQIELDGTPLSIPRQPVAWPGGRKRRLAGVSSFGFGGTNAHLIVEEAPRVEEALAGDKDATVGPGESESAKRPGHLLALSAKSEDALGELAGRYGSFLKSHPQVDPADVCFTANSGRSHFSHRLAVVAESSEQLTRRLDAFADGRRAEGSKTGKAQAWQSPLVAFLFTGQGSQYLGMGRQLYQTQPSFRRALDRCDELLRPYLDRPLLKILYPEAGETSPLDQTAYTQPALFALEYALVRMWRSWGIEPDVVIGHSLGEYVAACVAGIFSLEDGLKLTAGRARLIEALPRDGKMFALLADEARVAQAIRPYAKDVSLAAVNAPQQVVISGRNESVESVVAGLEDQGVQARRLIVSHAFHSPLMEPMLDEYKRLSGEVKFRPPRMKIVSTLQGEVGGEEMATAEYWCRHVLEPVRFAASMAAIEQLGCRLFLEVGPKPTLLGLGRRCLSNDGCLWLPSLRGGCPDWQQLLETVSELYVAGARIDWSGFDRDYRRRKIVLPTYPFQRQRCWARTAASTTTRSVGSLPGKAGPAHPLLGRRLHSAGKEIVFQGRIAADQLAFLADHRVCESPLLPASAYLEMALAAGAKACRCDSPVVQNLTIQQALRADQPQIVQVILGPEEQGSRQLEVFSLRDDRQADEGQGDEPSWTLHASGRLVVEAADVEGQDSQPAGADLASLTAECPQEIHVQEYYRLSRERGMDFGPCFQALKSLRRGRSTCLGEIHLPKSLATEADHYKFHPVLLDACFQVLGAMLFEADRDTICLLTQIERFRLLRPLSSCLWSHARVRPADSNGVMLTADVRIFGSGGELVAVVDGLQLKRVRRELLLAEPAPADDCMYEVHWRPRPRRGPQPPPDFLPAVSELGNLLAAEAARLTGEKDLEEYPELLGQLDEISAKYVLQAFRKMGWRAEPEERFSTASFQERLSVVDQHRRLLGRLLEILAEEGILRQVDAGWEVTSIPEAQVAQVAPDDLLVQFPAAEAELGLLARCGSRLADVLRGTCDPLELLFPDGDMTAATRLYQDSPGARAMNALVARAVAEAVRAAPPGRSVRVLEVGAGTGGTTSAILPHLPADQTRYTFTDLSPLFLANARDSFADFGFVDYQVLDVEQPPQPQGFGLNEYDVVVAANVLHATCSLKQALKHLRQLLAPGGMLILLEGTGRCRWLDLIFGLTEGWWRFTDNQLRPSYPLLSPPEWQTLLEVAGFQHSAAVCPSLGKNSEPADQAVIIATEPRLDPDESHDDGWLILADRQGVGEHLASLLRSHKQQCTLAFLGDDYRRVEDGPFEIRGNRVDDFKQLLGQIWPDRSKLRGIVHLWSLDAALADTLDLDQLQAASRLGCGSTLHLMQSLSELGLSEHPPLWLVTRGAEPVGPQPEIPGLAQSTLWGLGEVISLEYPKLKCARVDLDPNAGAAAAEALFDEVRSGDGEDHVAFRDRKRYVLRLAACKTPGRQEPQFRQHGSYLITGGLGPLGLRTARWMVEHGARNLVLLGRSGLPPRRDWPDLHPDSRTRKQVEVVQSLEESGAQVVVHKGDVADPRQMSSLFAQIADRLPPLRGIVHSAGVGGYQTVEGMEIETLDEVLRPKVAGAWILAEHARKLDLDFLVCFSSTSALWGAKGQAHYAAANRFLDAFAHYCRWVGVPASSVNWGLWAGGGMVDEAYRAWLSEIGADQQTDLQFDAFGGRANQSYRKWLAQLGMRQLSPEQGLDALGRVIHAGRIRTAVASVDWERFTKSYQATRPRPLLEEVSVRFKREGRADQSQPGAARLELLGKLKGASDEERGKLLVQYIRELIARVLGIVPSRMDVEQPLNNMGLDSLMAIELRNRVRLDLGLEVPMVKFMEGVNVVGLASLLGEQLMETQSAPPASPAATGEDGWIEGEL